jgi:FkbM family methyltransferase
MAHIDFRRAMDGELARARADRTTAAPMRLKGTSPATADVPAATHAATPAGRPFWLRLLRAPLTAPRRFLVGALHLKIDGIIARQHSLLTSLSTLQQITNANHAAVAELDASLTGLRQIANANQAAIADLRAIVTSMIAERFERMEGITVNRLHELDIKTRGPHDYDVDTVAVRLNDGYVLVPRSATNLRILLADAPADGLEPGTTRVLRKLLRPGMTAIDVGANVGALTLTCARAVGPTGSVFAFEPEPAFADLLAKAFDLNGVPWVELRRVAASRSSGRASFNVSPIGGHSSLYPLQTDEQRRETKIDVETCTLDDAVGVSRTVNLVKMDVEGAELDVFAGMTKIVAENPDLTIIAEFGRSHLKNQGVSADGWLDRFRSAGFSIFAINELTGDCRPAITDEILQVDSINLAMAKRGSRSFDILARRP